MHNQKNHGSKPVSARLIIIAPAFVGSLVVIALAIAIANQAAQNLTKVNSESSNGAASLCKACTAGSPTRQTSLSVSSEDDEPSGSMPEYFLGQQTPPLSAPDLAEIPRSEPAPPNELADRQQQESAISGDRTWVPDQLVDRILVAASTFRETNGQISSALEDAEPGSYQNTLNGQAVCAWILSGVRTPNRKKHALYPPPIWAGTASSGGVRSYSKTGVKTYYQYADPWIIEGKQTITRTKRDALLHFGFDMPEGFPYVPARQVSHWHQLESFDIYVCKNGVWVYDYSVRGDRYGLSEQTTPKWSVLFDDYPKDGSPVWKPWTFKAI